MASHYFKARCIDAFVADGLPTPDVVFFDNVSRPGDDKGWLQAILPLSTGGLGLGSVAELALSVFLASAAATVYPFKICCCQPIKCMLITLEQRLESGRQARHFAMNDILVKVFQKAAIPVIKEPAGLLENSNYTPDGYTVVSWAQGRSLAWDVTFPYTMAERYWFHVNRGWDRRDKSV
ncbi:hypothetical protein HELRODRAFT_172699 [Helobdella robusta]|uniref:Uncharacterized protein n=1 Tax=Helobdella robusta TaxID=6412 RepID=T1F5T4_HELRO|nr:hypothetical protein HELRODRAFT_172699 [Helobdella robusta]ESO04337.1 hypothetical protein HELRODRAFT_172699 [Helobdella robusta]